MYKHLLHLYHATIYSILGLIHAFKTEQAFQQECLVLLFLILALFFQEKDFLSWVIVINGWLFVISLELINSTLEKIFDLITQKQHPFIKLGKDMASAAVFITIIINIFIWIYIFIYS